MKLTRSLAVAALAIAVTTVSARASLAVTEIMSKSSQTEDWFELTNFGASSVDITGYTYDDSHADLSQDVAIQDVTSIAPGESIIVLQLGNDADKLTEVAGFRDFWGGLAGVQIATISSSGSSLGKADGVTIFDASESQVTQQLYGIANDEHAGVWAGGEQWDSANYTPNGWVGGASYDGQYGIFPSSTLNSDNAFEYGSPGTAVPEPATIGLFVVGGIALIRRRR